MRLFVAIPYYSAMPHEFVMCVNRLAKDFSPEPEISVLSGQSLIPLAMNKLTARFLETDCSHCLFVDGDILFSVADVERLLGHDLDIVCGAVPLRVDGVPRWAMNLGPDCLPRDERGLQRIRYAGSGFLCVKRCVFEKMIDAHGPEIEYFEPATGRREYHLWPVMVRHGMLLSEDFGMCAIARDLGFEVCADWETVLRHLGAAIYPCVSLTPDNVRSCHELLEADVQSEKIRQRERMSEALSRAK
jgi:hypothetical protein